MRTIRGVLVVCGVVSAGLPGLAYAAPDLRAAPYNSAWQLRSRRPQPSPASRVPDGAARRCASGGPSCAYPGPVTDAVLCSCSVGAGAVACGSRHWCGWVTLRLAEYRAELWADFNDGGRVHPIVAAGAGLARLAPDATEIESYGVGVLRGTLEYVLPVVRADARAALDLSAHVPAMRGQNAPDATVASSLELGWASFLDSGRRRCLSNVLRATEPRPSRRTHPAQPLLVVDKPSCFRCRRGRALADDLVTRLATMLTCSTQGIWRVTAPGRGDSGDCSSHDRARAQPKSADPADASSVAAMSRAWRAFFSAARPARAGPVHSSNRPLSRRADTCGGGRSRCHGGCGVAGRAGRRAFCASASGTTHQLRVHSRTKAHHRRRCGSTVASRVATFLHAYASTLCERHSFRLTALFSAWLAGGTVCSGAPRRWPPGSRIRALCAAGCADILPPGQ